MRNSLQLKQLVWAWIAAIWTCSAAAAQTTFASDLGGLPPAAAAVAALLAIIGGAAYTAQKMADPAVTVKSIPLTIISDILASVVAGLITFFLTSWVAWPAVLQAACITLAGYGGSRVIERYLLAGMARIDRIGGKPEGTP